MAAPQITVTFDPPLASDSGSEFDAKAFDTVAKFNPWGVEANGIATFVGDTAVDVLATAVAGNLSDLDFAAAAGYFIAVNEAGTGIDAVEVVELPQASQIEAESGVATGVYMDPLRTNQAVVATMNAAGAAPMYACRAWVNFNGTGTVAIRSSGNVSSITDNGTGNYTVNFTVPMDDVNYAQVVTGMSSSTASAHFAKSGTNKAVGSCRVWSGFSDDVTFTKADIEYIDVVIFR